MLFHLVAVWSVLCSVEGATLPAGPTHEKIINGTNASPGQYPFLVSIRKSESHFCGGTIINENWILTAAHCVQNKLPEDMSVQAGVVDLRDEGQIRGVATLTIHPNYSAMAYFGDIALIQLASPLEFNELVQPTVLPAQGQDTAEGESATVIGWGYNVTNGDVMDVLQTVDIFVVSDALCKELLQDKPHDSNICAAWPDGYKGECNGDSGGPLLVNGQQVGIVSWSIDPCTAPPYPGVFTEVSWFVDWILELTGAR